MRKQRSKQYFLDAAREIIITEGAENVTVRRVADLAGYSYPSLYHYFSDLSELMWEVRGVMIQELAGALPKRMQNIGNGVEGLKEVFKIYISYYFENPNVFKFFNYYSFKKPDSNTGVNTNEPDFHALWNDSFKGLVTEGKLKEQEIETVAKTIIYAVHGMITLSFSNNAEMTEEHVYKDLEKIIDYLL